MNQQSAEIDVREAVEDDVAAIRDIFEAVYGHNYPYRRFYDETWLKKSVFSDDILTLVAASHGDVVGTASVVYSAGARSDFVGEFGRLAVHPDARGRGIGSRLMAGRIRFAERRLHAGIIENRTEHPYSQRIAQAHGFAPVGFLPLKHCFLRGERESIGMFLRHFGPALDLRRNHPRLVPEAHTLAHMALAQCGLDDDVIVDDAASPYPRATGFATSSFESDVMASLLRIERGRVRNREVFGPIRLHYGFFKIADRNASYLVARDGVDGPMVGAIGYLHDEYENSVRVFELIARSDDAPRFLFEQLLAESREWGAEYVEVDVSAHAPRMQRTLVELGFVPAAYIPALVFHHVERVDVVKMVRLLVRPEFGEPVMTGELSEFASHVTNQFRQQSVLPQVEETLDAAALFGGLDFQQRRRLASLGEIHRFSEGESLFGAGDGVDAMFVVATGKVGIHSDGSRVGDVGAGESLGEVAMLVGGPHTSSAIVEADAMVISFDGREVENLIRLRPDIGVVLYRNLAIGLGGKLRRVDASLAEASSVSSNKETSEA